MLSLFRRGGVAQFLMGAIVFAIIVVFVLEFRTGRGATGELEEECAVEAYGGCVDSKDYFAAFGLIVPRGIPNKQLRQMRLRKHVLDGLVERELLVEDAGRLGISVSSEAIDAELAEGRAHVSVPVAQAVPLSFQLGLCLPQAMSAGCVPGTEMLRKLPVKSSQTERFDYKLYERVIRNTTNRSPKEFKEMQHREIIADRMRRLIRSRVKVSDKEAFLLFEREQSKAVVRVARIPRSFFAKYLVELSDVELKDWSIANQAQVDAAWETDKAQFTPDCPLVTEIRVQLTPGATDEEKTGLRDRLEQANSRVARGESFDRVARELGDPELGDPELGDPVQGIVGGEQRCLQKDEAELMAAVEGLKPPATTPILETADGFHLLRFEGRLPEAELEATGKQIVARRLALRFEADEIANRFALDLIDRAENGRKLEEALQELTLEYLAKADGASAEFEPAKIQELYGPRVEISAPFSISSTPVRDAAPGQNAAALAFRLEKIDSLVKQPIATTSGLAVLQLKEKTLATREEFEKDRMQIISSLQQAKSADALQRYVAELRARAKDRLSVNARYAEDPKSDEPGEG